MLKHGILGLLSYGNMTGYEIKEAFNSSLNFFWPAQTSQIYRELTALEKNKWIEKLTVEQIGKPNKNICSITDEGRKELMRWLSDSDINTEMRSATLMKTFFMSALPISDSLDFMGQLNKDYHAALEALEKTGSSIAAYQENIPDKKSAVFWQMTADFGRRYAQMYLDWTESCMKVLKDMEK